MSASTPSRSEIVESSLPQKIYLVSSPKIVFLYPAFVMALIAGIYGSIMGGDHELMATIFLAVFGLNLVVFTFDFPRTTSLTLVFAIVTIVLGALLLFKFNTEILPFLSGILQHFKPTANPTFYYTFCSILLILYGVTWINLRFDYWEVTPNELLHHHGVLSDLKRYSAPNMKIDKEITDVFEYLLLGSGRMILHPQGESRAIVLENVLFINRKERAITRMLGALQVRIAPANVKAD
jgi:hypothetical protein